MNPVQLDVPHCHAGQNLRDFWAHRIKLLKSKNLPFVSCVVPVLNEGRTIKHLMESIFCQKYPSSKIEVVVVDGGSTDDTCNVVRQLLENYCLIKLLGYGNLNTPEAMNIGIKHCRGNIVAKIDGHGYLDEYYIALAVYLLSLDSSIACVGGKITPLPGITSTQRANSLVRFSKFAVGQGPYTSPAFPHLTDSVQCGVYRKSDLVMVGCFDPDLPYGEDEELNWRLIKAGKKIIFHPNLRFHYEVRKTFGSIFKQYFNYGQARVKVLKKHPEYIKWKHCVPPTLVVVLLVTPFIKLLFPENSYLEQSWSFIWVTYFMGLIFAAALIGIKERYFNIPFLCCSLACIHLGYGLGFLKGRIDCLLRVCHKTVIFLRL